MIELFGHRTSVFYCLKTTSLSRNLEEFIGRKCPLFGVERGQESMGKMDKPENFGNFGITFIFTLSIVVVFVARF